MNGPPLIVHLVFRLDTGGLENALVNLINHMPQDRYRHAIVAMTEYTDFAERLEPHRAVQLHALHKQLGMDLGAYDRLRKLLRELKPALVHSRTYGCLDAQVAAWLAGVPARVHSEHGYDMELVGMTRVRRMAWRRAVQMLVHSYVAVSADLAEWLVREAGAPQRRVQRIYNGVDTQRFHPPDGEICSAGPDGFFGAPNIVIGTVGRQEAVKNPLLLADGFIEMVKRYGPAADRARLVMLGDGSLLAQCRKRLADAGLASRVWLPGNRDDVAEIIRHVDVFVLPSRSEGTSNTILEAMASGLPVIATNVGGNSELVSAGETGMLVPSEDPGALAEAIYEYMNHPELRSRQGAAAHAQAQQKYSMDAMVQGYLQVYDETLARRGVANRPVGARRATETVRSA